MFLSAETRRVEPDGRRVEAPLVEKGETRVEVRRVEMDGIRVEVPVVEVGQAVARGEQVEARAD